MAVGRGGVSALLSLSLQVGVGGEHRQVALAALELGHITQCPADQPGQQAVP